MNLYAAPDGILYIVDMYRGVIEHRNFLTQYLKDHVVERGLQTPLGLGRIYRVVHRSTSPRAESPQMTTAPASRLVELCIMLH